MAIRPGLETLAVFLQLDKARQLEVLGGPTLPVFLLGNTFIVVDTLMFFPEGLSYKTGSHCFKVVANALCRKAGI